MKIDILASGSDGNCIAITHEDQTILIDAGIAKTKIEKRLSEVGIRPDSIAGIFITHSHKDHIKGITLANKYGIAVYATVEEWHYISGVNQELRNNLDTVFGNYQVKDIGSIIVSPIKVYHDAVEPVGFKVYLKSSEGIKFISIILDTGKIDDLIFDHIEYSDVYIIEANHDVELLKDGDYPERLKERILSDTGHLSNEQTAKALGRLVKGLGEHIILTHLSKQNNLPALAQLAVRKELLSKKMIDGDHYKLEVY